MNRTWALCLCAVLAVGVAARADWTETNNDGGPGGLDQPGWVAAYNGSAPGPATNWHTAANLDVGGWGTDPGWTGNVVAITDADATAYAAANQVLPDFWRAKAVVAVSTQDPDEEFRAMVRANQFNMDDPPTAVSCYAATFNFNNAVGVGDPMEFKLYKIVNGVPVEEIVANPLVPAGFDDFILSVELQAVGRHITARLFDDTGDTTPLSSLYLYDYDFLSDGDTGVTALDTTAPSARADTTSRSISTATVTTTKTTSSSTSTSTPKRRWAWAPWSVISISTGTSTPRISPSWLSSSVKAASATAAGTSTATTFSTPPTWPFWPARSGNPARRALRCPSRLRSVYSQQALRLS